MSEREIHYLITLANMAIAGVVFLTLFSISAPYGRHMRRGWGPAVPGYLGWVIMEAPSALLFALYFALGSAPKNAPVILFFIMWEAHYLHRAFIYPFTVRGRQKPMPASVMVMAFLFNLSNSYINGRYLFTLSGGYPDSWISTPRFLVGTTLFVAGYVINRWSDTVLRGLRRPGETGYQIPRGRLFEWISCPNYFGEIVEWAGWAIATWSLPGLAFLVWTFANLAPRAHAHHAWYHAHFADYPPKRRALIPWIW